MPSLLPLPQSLRVKGTKETKILEVSSDRILDNEEGDSSKATLLKSLMETRADIMDKQKDTQLSDQQLQMERALVQKFVEKSFDRVDNQPPKSLEETKEILAFQRTEAERINQALKENETHRKELHKELEAVNAKIVANGGNGGNANNNANKFVLVSNIAIEYTPAVACDSAGGLDVLPLTITYNVMRKASWTPSYDVRINTETGKMMLTYFATVSQSSGEDWEDVDMSLCTADPSGTVSPKPVPKIEARERQMAPMMYARNAPKKSMQKRRGAAPMPSAPMQQMQRQAMPQEMAINAEEEGCSDDDDDGDGDDVSHALAATVKNEGDSVASAFVIPRKTDIKSSQRSSKVVIAECVFSPTIVHYTTPTSGDLSVFLQAKTLNDSPYILLPSSSVAIFVDGAFISTSKISQCAAGQSFFMYLGEDPGVKASYKPIKEKTSGGGWTNNNSIKDMMYTTQIHNTKGTDIKCLVADALPKSNDEKIVVELTEPKPSSLKEMNTAFASSEGVDLKTLGDGVYKDESGRTIMWVHTIKAGEKKKFNYSYTVSYPKALDLELFRKN
jgi:uncharacterized protein (TIGR02231 family)